MKFHAMNFHAMDFHDRVTVTIDDRVAHVLLDRADKMNAIDHAMFDALAAAGHYLHDADGVRCVILSGAGRAFCAGLDLAAMADPAQWGDSSLIERTHGNANLMQQAAMIWGKLPVPVIAAVHGVCFGGGLQIASGADIRIVAPDARLCVMETKWGLVPDMGGYLLWRGNVRDDVLRELIYTHREFGGDEAVQLGFATRVEADPLAGAWTMARQIAATSPQAIRAAKSLANRSPDLSADQILLAESHAQHALLFSRNQIEAVRAGMENRPPEFVDP